MGKDWDHHYGKDHPSCLVSGAKGKKGIQVCHNAHNRLKNPKRKSPKQSFLSAFQNIQIQLFEIILSWCATTEHNNKGWKKRMTKDPKLLALRSRHQWKFIYSASSSSMSKLMNVLWQHCLVMRGLDQGKEEEARFFQRRCYYQETAKKASLDFLFLEELAFFLFFHWVGNQWP